MKQLRQLEQRHKVAADEQTRLMERDIEVMHLSPHTFTHTSHIPSHPHSYVSIITLCNMNICSQDATHIIRHLILVEGMTCGAVVHCFVLEPNLTNSVELKLKVHTTAFLWSVTFL